MFISLYFKVQILIIFELISKLYIVYIYILEFLIGQRQRAITNNRNNSNT